MYYCVDASNFLISCLKTNQSIQDKIVTQSSLLHFLNSIKISDLLYEFQIGAYSPSATSIKENELKTLWANEMKGVCKKSKWEKLLSRKWSIICTSPRQSAVRSRRPPLPPPPPTPHSANVCKRCYEESGHVIGPRRDASIDWGPRRGLESS